MDIYLISSSYFDIENETSISIILDYVKILVDDELVLKSLIEKLKAENVELRALISSFEQRILALRNA